ncbi:MAG: hypothetical protein LBE67_02355 [Kocuria palustris]|nr:hypothetical protein [Kocuria palustris]
MNPAWTHLETRIGSEGSLVQGLILPMPCTSDSSLPRTAGESGACPSGGSARRKGPSSVALARRSAADRPTAGPRPRVSGERAGRRVQRAQCSISPICWGAGRLER